MALTLDDWAVVIQTSPILSSEQCNDLRESIHAGVFDLTKIKKVFLACSYIDFVNSHIDLWQILIDTCTNHLFDDDAPEPEPIDYIWDIISRVDGDSFLRELDKASIPIQLRTNILLAIGSQHNENLSTKLQDEIDLATT